MAGGYGIAPFHLFCRELRPRRAAGRGSSTAGAPRATCRSATPSTPSACRWSPPPTTAASGTAAASPSRSRPTSTAHGDRFQIYACGPDAMLHAVARVAARRGLPAQVSLDPWMGCGVGTCLGCVVRMQSAGDARPHYRCACTEGPVFDAREVVWPGDGESVARRRRAWRRRCDEPRRRRSARCASRTRSSPPPGPSATASSTRASSTSRSSAAWSPRACTSSRGTAARPRASWRRRRAC